MVTITSIDDVDGVPHATLFPGKEPKTIRLTLAAGEQVDPHRHPGREVLFVVVDGTARLDVGEATFELDVGDVARFGGDQDISPAAIEDCVALVVLAAQVED